MKRLLFLLCMCLGHNAQARAQWQSLGEHEWIIAFGTHNAYGTHSSQLFVSIPPQNVFPAFVLHRVPPDWFEADKGIAFDQGNIVSFVSLDSFFYANLYNHTIGTRLTYRTSDDGATWKELNGMMIASNGSYLFGTYQRFQ